MIDAQNSPAEDVERTESAEPSQDSCSELADRMAESLLAQQPDAPAWDRQFPASCGKGWG
jgi:hypothetical protein